MKLIIISLLSIICLKAQSQKCNELENFRDKELLAVYDKTISSLKINSEGKEMMEEIKTRLLDESWWGANDFSLAWAEVMRAVKFLCDKYSLVLGVSEKNKDIDEDIKKTAGSRSTQIDKSQVSLKLEQGFSISEIANNAFSYVAAKIQVENISGVVEVFIKLWNYKDLLESYMQDSEKLAKDQNALKLTVQNLIKELDSKVEKYQSEIDKAKENLESVEQIKQGIDVYMTKNCKPS